MTSASKILDDIKPAMADLAAIPAPPVLTSSEDFSPDVAIRFSDEGVEYVCAGPKFWANFAVSTPLAPDPACALVSRPLWGIAIIDIDRAENWRTRARVRLALARRLAA